MSYDFRIAWLLPETEVRDWAYSDLTDDHPIPAGCACISPRIADLCNALHAGNIDWSVSHHPDGTIELSSGSGGCEVLLTDYECEVGLPYGQNEADFRTAWWCLQVFAGNGATIFDFQIDTVVDPESQGVAEGWENYQRANRVVASGLERGSTAKRRKQGPLILNRWAYLWRWICLWIIVLATMVIFVRLGWERRFPMLALAPWGVGYLLKIFVLDPARLRSMGSNERLTFLSLIPPLAPILQIMLFLSSSKDR